MPSEGVVKIQYVGKFEKSIKLLSVLDSDGKLLNTCKVSVMANGIVTTIMDRDLFPELIVHLL